MKPRAAIRKRRTIVLHAISGAPRLEVRINIGGEVHLMIVVNADDSQLPILSSPTVSLSGA